MAGLPLSNASIVLNSRYFMLNNERAKVNFVYTYFVCTWFVCTCFACNQPTFLAISFIRHSFILFGYSFSNIRFFLYKFSNNYAL